VGNGAFFIMQRKTCNEISFLVEDAAEGGFCTRALGVPIFTDVKDLNDLRQKVRDAVKCHYDPADRPKLIRLHFQIAAKR
jgi:hypothetical protein